MDAALFARHNPAAEPLAPEEELDHLRSLLRFADPIRSWAHKEAERRYTAAHTYQDAVAASRSWGEHDAHTRIQARDTQAQILLGLATPQERSVLVTLVLEKLLPNSGDLSGFGVGFVVRGGAGELTLVAWAPQSAARTCYEDVRLLVTPSRLPHLLRPSANTPEGALLWVAAWAFVPSGANAIAELADESHGGAAAREA